MNPIIRGDGIFLEDPIFVEDPIFQEYVIVWSDHIFEEILLYDNILVWHSF